MSGMRLKVQSELNLPVGKAWERLLDPNHLVAISAPLVRFEGLLPDHWEVGVAYEYHLRILGRRFKEPHRIEFREVSKAHHRIQTEESGGLIRSWLHCFTLESIGESRCLYTDSLNIDAGPFTLGVWTFAQALYRHRHRRWKRLIRVAAS
ncbi:MAG: SRPBCC family protein [Bdellovibrionota bacterium]